MENRKWGIYIHVPWCRKKCVYCDFYSVIKKNSIHNFDKFIIKEFNSKKKIYMKNSAISLYFGGGTPSLLKTSVIGRIINYLYTQKALTLDAEITLEANPEDINANYANRLKKIGINRVSLGVQSFDDNILNFLSRNHTAVSIKKAVINLQNAKIININIDQIIGILGENIEIIKNAILWAKKNAVNHISIYMLTLKKKSILMSMIKEKKHFYIDDDYQALIYKKIQLYLKNLYFKQYEISNFSQNEFYSKHNMLYWGSNSYLGLGPGAHSMLLNSDGTVERMANVENLITWKNKPDKSVSFFEKLSNFNALLEGAAFGIRDMINGINQSKLELLYKCKMPTRFKIIMNQFVKTGFVCLDNDNLKLTKLGALFADRVSREILNLVVDKFF